MNKLFLHSIFFLSLTSYSQNNEFELNYNFGTAINNLKNPKKINYPNYNYREISNLNYSDISFLYKYKIFKKTNFYISTGMSFSKTKYLKKIIVGVTSSNFLINKNHLTIQMLGIYKEFGFYNGKLKVEFGLNAIKRFFFKTENLYTIEVMDNTVPNISTKNKYTYKIYYYHNAKKLHLSIQDRLFRTFEYSLQLKYRILKNTFLKFGLKYSKVYFFYYNFIHYTQTKIESTPSTIYATQFGSFEDKKKGIVDNFLSFNFGVSYKF